ncbi:ABC transporter substrate-binding protein [Aquabacter spiritensis]|uniref:NitT/TauT family transport system substrate-binding protein n=1 Tax=Aquabacter spiritensis TaxID=933073 RepID=A0A4R3LJZ9_9HYPH|nr:ABC transporter substrate-binding protein [Aquabacter spiritensis]TCT00610.1 NitT/TauT family transport system substrate-binding protein [Aquabacter spiritensis]
MKPLRRLILGLVALATLPSVSAVPAHALDQVVLRINFTPWAMHAQYYAAIAQGFYAKEGIAVEIRAPSAGQSSEVLVGSGREQFGVANIDSFVKARANGIPVVAVMADQPDTPTSVITLKSSNITKPSDLKGKRITWFSSNVKGQIDPLLKAGGLTRDDIEFVLVSRGSEVQLVAAGKMDALWGYAFGQALTLESKGFPVNIMPLKDYGLKNYGTLLYTSDALLKSNPDLVRRFVKATLQGLIWTHDHLEAAVAEVVKVAPDRDLKLETQKLAIIYDLYKSPDFSERFGKMNEAKWETSINALAEDIPQKPKASDMFTNAIVDSLDESKDLATVIRTPAK